MYDETNTIPIVGSECERISMSIPDFASFNCLITCNKITIETTVILNECSSFVAVTFDSIESRSFATHHHHHIIVSVMEMRMMEIHL